MDRRTAGIIATIAAVLLCGCPGLVALFAGLLFAGVSQVPGAEIDMMGRNDPQSALNAGITMLCLGVIFIVIPIVVGFLTLRNRPASVRTINMPPDEPLPPAS